MRLSDLHTGERGIVVKHHSDKAFRKRLLEMGFIPGEEISVVKNAPLLDPVEYRILGYDLTLRREEAKSIEVIPVGADESGTRREVQASTLFKESEDMAPAGGCTAKRKNAKTIRVTFVGNPNCGKTSLFNAASGANEHVGNYSGVTVDVKTAYCHSGDYTFELIDLPGTYSLSSYSPEEKFVLDYLLDDTSRPDVVLNVVDSSNLERHLYMTTQLIESSMPMVVALNMYDELEASSSALDVVALSKLLGVPMVPTVGRTGRGLKSLLREIITVYENRSHVRRMKDVHYHETIEKTVKFVREEVAGAEEVTDSSSRGWGLRPRFVAIKLLEEDPATIQYLRSKDQKKAEFLIARARYALREYEKKPGADFQQDVTNGRYGFVHGALLETYSADYTKITEKNRKIDHILTHRIWGLPIFVVVMYLVFQLTFTLGQYPMDWIGMGVTWLGGWIGSLMSDGPLKDLIVDGVIAGVGGVLVFLPNIVILYLCIALMEDTGYLARAAFIMDKLMHMIGLHGKSFIPLLMGFGCNVPAIMSTRTIENRNARIITMLITPFMSCSARLPIYLLLAGAFFPKSAGIVLFGLYFGGILIAVMSALLFRRFLFSGKDTPFVMELPPYRIPTGISVLLHMWQRAKQYLQKMGTTILLASITIWALGYFPRLGGMDDAKTQQAYDRFMQAQSEEEKDYFISLPEDQQLTLLQQEYSYIGRLGYAVQPIFAPMNYDWRMSVALLTGIAAKEVVVSTMGVLYVGDRENEVALSEKLHSATYPNGTRVFNAAIALSFMVFVLIYFPCIATFVVIGKEAGSWKWATFLAVYSTISAWVMAWLTYLAANVFV